MDVDPALKETQTPASRAGRLPPTMSLVCTCRDVPTGAKLLPKTVASPAGDIRVTAGTLPAAPTTALMLGAVDADVVIVAEKSSPEPLSTAFTMRKYNQFFRRSTAGRRHI